MASREDEPLIILREPSNDRQRLCSKCGQHFRGTLPGTHARYYSVGPADHRAWRVI